ncbi:MAG: hypothetical protein CNLJKLNK_00335 [Holosporales bacterium]
MTLNNIKKKLIKAVLITLLCFWNIMVASNVDKLDRIGRKIDTDGRSLDVGEQSVHKHQDAVQKEGHVSYQDFMRMSDEQIQKVREVVIHLEESYFPYEEICAAFNEKLQQNKNIIVILDCDNATNISDYCLYDIHQMRKMTIINADKVTHIGEMFLYNCKGLITLDLGPLSNVIDIADEFLYNCSGLTTLDLRPLSNVIEIRYGFLQYCDGLTTLDLRPFSHIKGIDGFFLNGCNGLTTLDLTPLSNVTSIGEMFLFGCDKLTHATVTIPRNWRFDDRLPGHLNTSARWVGLISKNAIDYLIKHNIDPRRPGSGYTEKEMGVAGSLMQGAPQSKDGYLKRLQSVFSAERALKILDDVYDGDDHSFD